MIRSAKILSLFAVAFVLIFAGQMRADETKGTISSVNAEKKEVVLKGTIKNTLYELEKDAVVDLDGVKSSIANLKEGDRAFIRYQKSGEHLMAGWVRALRNAQEGAGTVRSTFAEKNELMVKGIVKDTKYELNKDATVWVNGKESKLADLRESDEVTVTYQVKGDHNMAIRVMATRK